jgi:peptidylprolyl isomerase
VRRIRNAQTESRYRPHLFEPEFMGQPMRRGIPTFFILLFLLAGPVPAGNDFLETGNGARYRDLQTGTGPVAETGDVATMHFTGWLDDNGSKGRQFFDSRREGRPVTFVIGTERVMPGWNEGVVGMQAGGRRLLKLPPALGYGNRAVEDVIPANAGLIFVIELIGLEKRQ